DLADKFLEETNERERLGLATRVDVLQAAAARAQRMEEIINAQAALEDAADEIFRLLDLLPEDAQDTPTTAPLPSDKVTLPEFQTIWRTALDQSPQLRVQETQLQ